MRFSAILCWTAVIAFATSVSVSSTASATTKAHSAHVYRVAHHVTIPAKAEALAPSVAPVVRRPETDGLSRNPEDCNMGCIDNN